MKEKERNNLYNKFKKNLLEECRIDKGDSILMGCSGGPDSMAMLYLFWEASKELELKLYICHINYKLRGEASDKDEEIVKENCKKLNLPCIVDIMKINKEYQFSNLEEILREYRYKVFYKKAEENKCKWIAVAHNKNDQAETLLLNLIRGAGTEGLAAMSYKRTNMKIIRPILNIDREEIMQFIKENKIDYGEDHSNYTLAYTRNKIRNLLLPLIVKEFNPEIINILFQTSLIIGSEGTLLEKICQKYMDILCERKEKYISVPIEEFRMLPIAVKRRLARLMYKEITGNTRRLHFNHLESILRRERNNENTRMIDLPNGVRVGISKDKIEFYLKDFYGKIKRFEYRFQVPAKVNIVELEKEVELFVIDRKELREYDSSKKILYVDYDKCEKELIIRNRREGDMFKALGAPGRKKLKDYLIDKKIPREERDKLMLLADKNDIICIIGMEVNDKYKVRLDTKKILCVRINK